MVLRLVETLQVPLRERNALLLAAGYAPLYRQTALDSSEVEAARRAVEFLMAQLDPYPVLVLDRYWNRLRMNAGAKRFLALFPGCDSGTPHNGPRLVFHPQGLRPFLENWGIVAARILHRVHREAADWRSLTLRLFSALTTFGTAQDIALQELRIESFFPADEATRTVLNRLTEEAF
jgi:hypothetical protein